jgi:phosphoribosylformylglycinamidine synthase
MRRWLPIGLILLGVAVIAYALLGSSDEDRILARLAQLAQAVRVDEGERNPLVRHGRIRQEFAEIFVKEANARIPEISEGLHGRDALAAAATQVGSVYQSADVSLGSVDLRVDPGGTAAEATATATIAGAMHGQPPRSDDRRVKFRLDKVDGDWKIVSVTVEREADSGPEAL